MQKRHFIVQEVNGDYHLKEIDSAIAKAISIFGTITGQYQAVEASDWFFYFMNCPISASRANEIAEKLSHDFLEGKR